MLVAKHKVVLFNIMWKCWRKKEMWQTFTQKWVSPLPLCQNPQEGKIANTSEVKIDFVLIVHFPIFSGIFMTAIIVWCRSIPTVLQDDEDFKLFWIIRLRSSFYTGGFPCLSRWLQPSGLLIQRENCDRPVWGPSGREMTLSCTKSIEVTRRGHNQKTCATLPSQGDTIAVGMIDGLWCDWHRMIFGGFLTGQSEKAHLWQGSKSTVIYSTQPSRRGPAQSPCHNRRCIVRRSTASKNNHSQRLSLTHSYVHTSTKRSMMSGLKYLYSQIVAAHVQHI